MRFLLPHDDTHGILKDWEKLLVLNSLSLRFIQSSRSNLRFLNWSIKWWQWTLFPASLWEPSLVLLKREWNGGSETHSWNSIREDTFHFHFKARRFVSNVKQTCSPSQYGTSDQLWALWPLRSEFLLPTAFFYHKYILDLFYASLSLRLKSCVYMCVCVCGRGVLCVYKYTPT